MNQRWGTLVPPRAVGLSVTMFFFGDICFPQMQSASRPDCGTLSLPQKNISTSIPLAPPTGTTPRFAANSPLPSPEPFTRAANPATLVTSSRFPRAPDNGTLQPPHSSHNSYGHFHRFGRCPSSISLAPSVRSPKN